MAVVTIILPVYNNEDTVEACIASIKEQTLTDFECIIVNDGSTDNSLSVINKSIQDDSRFTLIDSMHKGLSTARNIGIRNATSPIIMYIDADDLALPMMMHQAVTFLNTYDLDMMIFDAEPFNCDVSPLKYKGEQKYFTRRKDYGISTGKEYIYNMLKNRDYVYAVFIQAIRKNKIKYKFYPKMRAQDELYTIQNLYMSNKVGHLHEVLYKKSCRRASVANSRQDTCFMWSRLKTLEELILFAERERIPEEDIRKIIFPIMKRNLLLLPYVLKNFRPEDLDGIKLLFQNV